MFLLKETSDFVQRVAGYGPPHSEARFLYERLQAVISEQHEGAGIRDFELNLAWKDAFARGRKRGLDTGKCIALGDKAKKRKDAEHER